MQASVNTAVFLTALQTGTSQFTCLKTLIDQPIANVEVRGEFFSAATRERELFMIDTLCKAQGWGLYFSIPEQLFTAGKLNDHLADYLALASRHHIGGLKISLGDPTGVSAATYAHLQALVATYPGQLTVENQPNVDGQMPAFAERLRTVLKAVPALGYTFDAGNWYWVASRPEEAFAALQDVITVFHLKDIRNQETVMLGTGQTDWQALVSALAPEIPVFIEYAIAPEAFATQLALVNTALAAG